MQACKPERAASGVLKQLCLSGLLVLTVSVPSEATEDLLFASAKMMTPVDIVGEGDLAFGTVAIPRTETCVYELTPRSETLSSKSDECRFLSGSPIAAEFSVACSPSQPVTFEAIFTNSAPTGTSFGAGTNSLEIDGLGAGDILQVQSCDKDGFSEVRVGGRLSVTPNAPEGFSGEVGTIRLEANY
tara:strand:+ start:1804 stop:2361 length:558 start_codon:yes stop_codon:yes gene_type:complete